MPDSLPETHRAKANPHSPRVGKYLPLVAALLLPLLVEVAFERTPAQSGLAELEVQKSPLKGDRGRRLGLPARRERPLTRRVLFIVLDAWRRKVAFDDSKMPHLAALVPLGSRGNVLAGLRTLTKPCVRRLMTGRTSSLRDSALNLLSDPVSEESLLTRLNAAGDAYTLIDVTPAFSGLFEQQCRPGSLVTPSVKGQAWDSEDPSHDSLVEAACLRVLGDQRQKFIMVHLEDLDLAGHIYGPGSSRYARVLRAMDDRVARLALHLDFERDTLVVIGDHGSDDSGHHGGPDSLARETAYLAVGAGVTHANRPLDPLDVADSLAVLLGRCPPLDSEGAPNPQLLAIDPHELKSRCDRCLLDRLRTLPGPMPRWLSTTAAKEYFEATAFSPKVAALYRRVANPLPAERHFGRVVAVGLTTMAISLVALLMCQMGSRAGLAWIGVLVVMAFLPFRDAIAVVVYAALLTLVSFKQRPLARLAGLVVACALVASPLFFDPTPLLYRIAGHAGFGALVLGACLLAPQAFRPSRLGKAAPLVLIAVGACIAAHLVPNDHMPGAFSASVTLIDLALAAGAFFLILGLVFKEGVLIGLASLALAGCVFQGWPLLIFVGFEILLRSSAAKASIPLAEAFVWAPVGMLALLRAENGGYGFSKIDLSLAVLGSAKDAVDYRWAAGMILVAYGLPLLLAIRVALTMNGKDLAVNLSAALAAFLLFAGADLMFISAPAIDRFRTGGYEEILTFDLVMSTLVCILQGLTVAWFSLRETGVLEAAAGLRVSTAGRPANWFRRHSPSRGGHPGR